MSDIQENFSNNISNNVSPYIKGNICYKSKNIFNDIFAKYKNINTLNYNSDKQFEVHNTLNRSNKINDLNSITLPEIGSKNNFEISKSLFENYKGTGPINLKYLNLLKKSLTDRNCNNTKNLINLGSNKILKLNVVNSFDRQILSTLFERERKEIAGKSHSATSEINNKKSKSFFTNKVNKYKHQKKDAKNNNINDMFSKKINTNIKQRQIFYRRCEVKLKQSISNNETNNKTKTNNEITKAKINNNENNKVKENINLNVKNLVNSSSPKSLTVGSNLLEKEIEESLIIPCKTNNILRSENLNEISQQMRDDTASKPRSLTTGSILNAKDVINNQKIIDSSHNENNILENNFLSENNEHSNNNKKLKEKESLNDIDIKNVNFVNNEIDNAKDININNKFYNDVKEPINIFNKNWQPQLGQKLLMMANGNIKQAILNLTPENLGKLHVKLNIDNDNISVLFKSDQIETSLQIEQSIDKLKDMFFESDLHLVDVNVFFDQSENAYKNFAFQIDKSNETIPNLTKIDDGSVNKVKKTWNFRKDNFVDLYI